MMNWFRNIIAMSRPACIFLLIAIFSLLIISIIAIIALTPFVGFPLAFTIVIVGMFLCLGTIILISS